MTSQRNTYSQMVLSPQIWTFLQNNVTATVHKRTQVQSITSPFSRVTSG